MEDNIKNIPTAVSNFLKEVVSGFNPNVVEYNKITIPKEQAWGIYKIRFNIKLSKQTLSDDSRKIYETTLDKLQKFDEDNVSVHSINYNNIMLIVVFMDVSNNKFIGHLLFNELENTN